MSRVLAALLIILFNSLFCRGNDKDINDMDSLLKLSELRLDDDLKTGIRFALQYYERAFNAGNNDLKARALINLSNYLRASSDFDSALVVAERAVELIKNEEMPSIQLQGLLSLGLTYQRIGNHEAGLEYFTEARRLSQNILDSISMAKCDLFSADTYSNYGENVKSRDLVLDAYRLFKKKGDQKHTSIALNLLGDIHAKMGENGDALEHFFEGLEIARKIDNIRVQLKHYNRLGAIYAIEGKLDESLKYFNLALNQSESLDSKYDYSGILNNIAYIYTLKDDLITAQLHYKKSIEYNQRYELPCLIPYATEGMARLYEKLDMLDSAVVYYNNALEYVQVCQMHQNEVTILRGLGNVALRQNNTNKAISILKKALSIAQDANFKRPAMQIAGDLYNLYKSRNDFEAALHYHEIYKMQQDSLLNKKNIEDVTRITERYEFDKERERLQAERARESLLLQEEIKRQDLSQTYFLIGLIISFGLIAALLRMYFKKRQANDALVKLNEEKNVLIGVVAHDLRSPLNNVISLVPLVRENVKILNQEVVQFFELINQSTARMKDMINRVLDINAIESHKININLEVCDLAQLLDNVAENYKSTAEPKRINIEHGFVKDKYLARVDKNYLIQVLDNLVSNAIKFSPHGTTVKLDVYEAMGKVNAIIQDEGPGFSEDDKKQIFERYNVLSAKPTGGESSTGLGLSIVKRYIEAMKGIITLDSKLGQGSKFILQFNAI